MNVHSESGRVIYILLTEMLNVMMIIIAQIYVVLYQQRRLQGLKWRHYYMQYVCYDHRDVSPPPAVPFIFMLIYIHFGVGVAIPLVQLCPAGCLVSSRSVHQVFDPTFSSTANQSRAINHWTAGYLCRPTFSLWGDWPPCRYAPY